LTTISANPSEPLGTVVQVTMTWCHRTLSTITLHEHLEVIHGDGSKLTTSVPLPYHLTLQSATIPLKYIYSVSVKNFKWANTVVLLVLFIHRYQIMYFFHTYKLINGEPTTNIMLLKLPLFVASPNHKVRSAKACRWRAKQRT